MQPFEIIEVSAMEVVCDGAGAGSDNALGHPRVFLHIDQDSGSITCPYCSRQYVLRANGRRVASGH